MNIFYLSMHAKNNDKIVHISVKDIISQGHNSISLNCRFPLISVNLHTRVITWLLLHSGIGTFAG